MSAKSQRLDKLKNALSGRERLLILTHENPDPDAVASAFGLQHLVNSLVGVEPVLGYSGYISRAENRQMISELEIPMENLRELDLETFDGFLMVDVQPQAGNHALPEDKKPLVVIDHHPAAERLPEVEFRMVKKRCGSTSTIIAELLKEANATIDERLATALVYGIKSDTRDLGRVTRQKDVETFMYLFPKANLSRLADIEHARLPRVYFEDLRDAISEATIKGDAVITRVGVTDSRDIIPEMADLFLRLEGMSWSACYGYFNKDIIISLRSADKSKRCDKAIRSIVKDLGTGGGHATMAAGQIPAENGDVRGLEKKVMERIHSALRVRRRKEHALVDGRARVKLTRKNVKEAPPPRESVSK